MTKAIKGEIKKFNTQLSEEQKLAKARILQNKITVLKGSAGCLSKGTKVLMFDGSFKEVEYIEVGDKLMGIDSTPRTVLSTTSGTEQMYWIRQLKGMDYRVNESHILSLKRLKQARYRRKTIEGKRHIMYDSPPICEKTTETINIPLLDFLKIKNTKNYKGYISNCIHFQEKSLSIDPYYFGLWLGDGSKRM